MDTTFEVQMSAADARYRFGDWRCRIERLDGKTCNIVFFDEAEWNRFEEYAQANEIEYKLV